VLNRWLPARKAPAAPPGASVAPAASSQASAPAGALLRALAPLIDLAATLNRLGGDEGLLERALDAFRRDPSRPELTAAEALARGDLREARSEVHPLRGLAGTLGLTRAAACCAELEACLDAGDREGSGAALGRLQEAMAEIRADLDKVPI
jgi:HPt (histidine-containing phosphotransfer) domain-containing protein